MTAKLNRCYFQAASAGSADFVYSGTVSGFQSPLDAGAVDEQSLRYIAEVLTGGVPTQWEIGAGIWSTDTLTRVPLQSSNGGLAVDFSEPPKVRMGVPLTTDMLPEFVATEGEDGEHIHITAGLGTAGRGGDVIIITGASETNDGGTFYLQAGQGDDGGSMHILSGEATTGDGGEIEMLGGRGPAQGGGVSIGGGQGLDGPGGIMFITGGNGATAGGNIRFEGGEGSQDSGGSLVFRGGNGDTVGGDITFTPGAGNSVRNGQAFLNVPESDPLVAGAIWWDGDTLKRSAG